MLARRDSSPSLRVAVDARSLADLVLRVAWADSEKALAQTTSPGRLPSRLARLWH